MAWNHGFTHKLTYSILTMRTGFKQLSILFARLCVCRWNHTIINHKNLSILKKLCTWHHIFLFLVVFYFSLITNFTSVFLTYVYAHQIEHYK